MQKTLVNPWQWQDNLGYAQAVEVKNNTGTLYVSGQAAMNEAGQPVGGTMEAQVNLSLQNLTTVLQQSGYMPSNIVRLNFYTTSTAAFFEAYGTVISWLQHHRATPASTLIQVSGLAFPELNVEIEATVVQ